MISDGDVDWDVVDKYQPYSAPPDDHGIAFDQERADRVVEWVEQQHHLKGEKKGEKIELMDWQKKILRDIFGTVDETGKRQYSTVYIEIPRKQGKSTLMAALELYMLLADGEPGPEIYSLAFDRDQASIIFDMALDMAREHDKIHPKIDATPHKKLMRCPANGGKLKALSRETRKKGEGLDIHAAFFDEFRNQPDRKMWDKIDTAIGSRREPLIVIITTAGDNKDCPCWDFHQRTEKVNKGALDYDWWYGVIYSSEEYAEDHEEGWWKDVESWYISNPALQRPDGTGFRQFEDMKRKAQEARDDTMSRNKFLRYYHNIWVSPTSQFIPPEKWAKCGIGYNESIDLVRA